ncbi:tRNA adenosine(34) deaminase TadA [Pedococcus badiiscoriae]|nr:tRNA adenosine(34) deaminase TadA [Pedococcus badiiscoriae]
MGHALDLAAAAARDGDVPVGAIVVSPAGEVLGEGRNLREVEGDPTAHAEVVALRAAARALGQWRLEDCTLVVTLEPCPMCAGALMLSRISRLVLGAWDPKLGATGSVWDLVRDRRATHRVEVIGGVREAECSQVLLAFFEQHRATGAMPAHHSEHHSEQGAGA